MRNYSIVTVGSEDFFECLQEQKLDYNVNQLNTFKEASHLFKNYNVQDGFVFLFFLDNLEKIKIAEAKKIMFPKIFFSSDPKQFKDLKKDNLFSTFLQTPISFLDLEKIIKLSILKFKFHFQAKIEIGQYILDKNKRTLSIGRKNIKLTEKEQDIIVYLFGKKDGANKKDIMKDIWSYSDEVDTHTYETHLYRLRQKIQTKLKDKNFIEIREGKYFLNK
jgi:hypothetical protein|tara:strand:- start:585 stop:1241 length:657 start_codon:yes stop_codon:yes gene_type:complete